MNENEEVKETGEAKEEKAQEKRRMTGKGNAKK